MGIKKGGSGKKPVPRRSSYSFYGYGWCVVVTAPSSPDAAAARTPARTATPAITPTTVVADIPAVPPAPAAPAPAAPAPVPPALAAPGPPAADAGFSSAIAKEAPARRNVKTKRKTPILAATPTVFNFMIPPHPTLPPTIGGEKRRSAWLKQSSRNFKILAYFRPYSSFVNKIVIRFYRTRLRRSRKTLSHQMAARFYP
jgi:hypothetical protein